jgi:hypothetical protein
MWSPDGLTMALLFLIFQFLFQVSIAKRRKHGAAKAAEKRKAKNHKLKM